MVRLVGLLVLVAGFAAMLGSFYADDLGLGRYGGAGPDQAKWTLFSLLMQGTGPVQGTGLLLVIAPARPR